MRVRVCAIFIITKLCKVESEFVLIALPAMVVFDMVCHIVISLYSTIAINSIILEVGRILHEYYTVIERHKL